MKKNKIKKKSKAKFYTIFHVFIVIILFFLLDLWSVGDFKNYKKMSDFRSDILESDIKFDEFPPRKLFGVKLYDDIKKYTLKDTEAKEIEINGKIYTGFYYDTKNDSLKKRFKVKVTPPFEEYGVMARENGEVVLIVSAIEDMKLENNNNFLKVCTNTRDTFLKNQNFLKSDFERRYFKETAFFHDFLSTDYTVDKKIGELSKSEKARFSIVCEYKINQSSIDYRFIVVLSDIDMIENAFIKENMVEINIIPNDLIRKYRKSIKNK